MRLEVEIPDDVYRILIPVAERMNGRRVHQLAADLLVHTARVKGNPRDGQPRERRRPPAPDIPDLGEPVPAPVPYASGGTLGPAILAKGDRARAMYVDDEATIAEIADELHMGVATVGRLLRHLGVTIRPKGHRRRKQAAA